MSIDGRYCNCEICKGGLQQCKDTVDIEGKVREILEDLILDSYEKVGSMTADKALSQILALLPATLTKEEIKEELDEAFDIGRNMQIAQNQGWADKQLNDIATALEGKVSVGGREDIYDILEYDTIIREKLTSEEKNWIIDALTSKLPAKVGEKEKEHKYFKEINSELLEACRLAHEQICTGNEKISGKAVLLLEQAIDKATGKITKCDHSGERKNHICLECGEEV